jgi:hypothetical protein
MRNTVKPCPKRRLSPHGRRVAHEHQERSLKCILGLDIRSEHLAARRQHLGPMPPDNRLNGRGIAPLTNPRHQRRIAFGISIQLGSQRVNQPVQSIGSHVQPPGIDDSFVE